VANGGWKRRGRLVRDERAGRWRTAKEFAAAAGLSESLVDDIENGRRDNFKSSTVEAVETALGWAPGSFERAGRSGHPERLADPEFERVRAAWPQLSIDARRILAALAELGLRN